MDTLEKTTAKDILALLRQRYSDGLRYACAAEVPSKTGFGDRRLDFVVVNCWHSDGLKIEVFEIKVSKSDLKHELEHPEKHNWAFSDIDNYWLVAPEEIVDMDILPKKWGVMVVRNGQLSVKRKPIPLHDDSQHYDVIKRDFAIALIRAMNNASLERSLIDNQLREERLKAFAEGKSAGIKEVGDARIDAEKFLWMDRFCYRLDIRTKEAATRKLDEIQALESLKANGEWLKSAIDNVVSQATRLQDRFGEALKEGLLSPSTKTKEVKQCDIF